MKLTQALKLEKFPLPALLLLPLIALLFSGCATEDYSAVMAAPDGSEASLGGARLHSGDSVTISFDGLPEQLLPQEKTINDDGTITLSDIGTIKAAGKTTGELEKAIHDLYVPHIYTHLTVTVKAGDRVYYVRGEVRTPGRQIYVGQITVTKAITSAGDFADFANHKNVLLIRSNGQRYRVNCDKILRGDAPDPGVYPGDQIMVEKRAF